MKKIFNIGKTEQGEEILGVELETKINVLSDYEIEIIGSTTIEDRAGESIDQNGWDLKNFKKNPVILPAHDYRQPAIGKATSIKIKEGNLVFRVQFPEEGVNPVADIYRKLYKGGFMNASSVGFIPKEWTDGDGKKAPYRSYTKQELLELSLVSVPCNPEALVSSKGVEEAVKKGVLNSKDVQELLYYTRALMKQKEGDQNVNEHVKMSSVVEAINDDEEEGKQKEEKTASDEQGDLNKFNNDIKKQLSDAQITINLLMERLTLLSDKCYSLAIDLKDLEQVKAGIKWLEDELKKIKELRTSQSKHYLDLPDQSESNSDSLQKDDILQVAKDALK